MSDAARAVLYVRLSKASDVSTSIKGQNDELFARAQHEGWNIVATFEDNGRSGGKQRDNAVEALRMIREGEADVLAVYAYDRWSRMGIADSAEVINAIYARVKTKHPARFVAMREGIDSDHEGWELLTAFTADIAQKERDRMVSRRTAAIGRMRAEGRNPGNGPAPIGYRSAPFADGRPGKRYVVDPAEAAMIREVAERLVAGEPASTIARELTERRVPMPRSPYRLALMKGEAPVDEHGQPLETGTWNSSRVYQTWQSDHLLGRMRVNTSRARGGKSNGTLLLDPETGLPATPFEPILDVATFDAIKERFNPYGPRTRRAARLLSGLAYCAGCGGKMYVMRKSKREAPYYRCGTFSTGRECPAAAQMKAETLEAEVVSEFRVTFGRRPATKTLHHVGDPAAAQQLALVKERARAIGAELAESDDPDRMQQLLTDLASMKQRRAELEAAADATWTEVVQLGMTVGEQLSSTDDVPAQRRILQEELDHVSVHKKTATPAGEPRVRLFAKIDYTTDDPS